MKIAIFHNLPSGGAKRALGEMVRRLSPRHQLDVFTLSCANHEFADLRPFVARHAVTAFQPAPLLKFPLARFNQAVRLLDLWRLQPVARRIARQMEHNGYDVVLVNLCQFENSPSLLKYLRRIPTVYYCQEPLRRFYESMPVRPYEDGASRRRQVMNRLDPLPLLYQRTLKALDRRNIRSAGLVLVNSEYIRGLVRGIYQREARVSYLGVDEQFFRPLPTAKRPGLLSVGSLTPLKGFDFLIESVAQIPAEQRPALVIASNFQNPPERQYLEQLAGERRVDVQLLNNISDDDLRQLYNQATLTVYAPHREPFGLVSLESMACGTPVVAVREGGIPEAILHGQVGWLVDRDPAQFAEGVRHLLANPKLISDYGQQGREHVLRHWTWERAVNTLEHTLMFGVTR
jgi:glycosyltransferase involved in cell wall biosynthesis